MKLSTVWRGISRRGPWHVQHPHQRGKCPKGKTPVIQDLREAPRLHQCLRCEEFIDFANRKGHIFGPGAY